MEMAIGTSEFRMPCKKLAPREIGISKPKARRVVCFWFCVMRIKKTSLTHKQSVYSIIGLSL